MVGDAVGKAFFSLNKWHGFLLYFCQILLLLFLSPPAYRGGVERGVALALICRDRGVIRPFCITILYHNLLLFIDIFHI
jgi:hypothetical protein